MSTDDGKTHYVGDGCQPAHDPRIDQTETKRAGPKIEQWSVVAPPTADNGNPWRVIDAAQKTVAIVPNSPREKRARLIASAPELLAELERLRAARVEQNDEYLSLQQEVERWKSAHDTCCDGGQKLVAEVERLTVELTHRVGWEERCLDAEAALATLRAENARLRAVVALARLPDPVYGDDYGARCVYCGSIEDGHAESCPWVKLNGALSLLASEKAS
jgi:hypothetical protein